MVVAPNPSGVPVVASFITGTSETTYASGKKDSNTFSCANWSTEHSSIFKAEGACTFTNQNGDKASIVSGCDYTNKDQTESDCWGGLMGLTGSITGKTGTMAWHSVVNPDGKTGSAAGTGQWN